MSAATGTAAACSNVRLAGFSTTARSSRTHTYSAKAPVSPAEHLVTRSKLRDVLADRFHRSGKVGSHPRLLRPEEPHLRAADPRCAGHAVPVHWVHRGRANPYQHLIVRRVWLVDLLGLENIG